MKKQNGWRFGPIDLLLSLIAVGATIFVFVLNAGGLDTVIFASVATLLLNTFSIIFSAKGYRICYVAVVLSSLTATYVAFSNNFLGNAMVNLFFHLPLAILSFYFWGKNQRADFSVKVRELSLKKRWLVGILAIELFLVSSLLIQKFGGDIALADGFIVVCGVFSAILAMLRFREHWFFCFCADVVLFGIWVYAGNPCMLALRIINLVGDTYGYINWRKLLTGKSVGKLKKT